MHFTFQLGLQKEVCNLVWQSSFVSLYFPHRRRRLKGLTWLLLGEMIFTSHLGYSLRQTSCRCLSWDSEIILVLKLKDFFSAILTSLLHLHFHRKRAKKSEPCRKFWLPSVLWNHLLLASYMLYTFLSWHSGTIVFLIIMPCEYSGQYLYYLCISYAGKCVDHTHVGAPKHRLDIKYFSSYFLLKNQNCIFGN